MSHLEGPKGREDRFSLQHVVNYLNDFLEANICFGNDCIGPSNKIGKQTK